MRQLAWICIHNQASSKVSSSSSDKLVCKRGRELAPQPILSSSMITSIVCERQMKKKKILILYMLELDWTPTSTIKSNALAKFPPLHGNYKFSSPSKLPHLSYLPTHFTQHLCTTLEKGLLTHLVKVEQHLVTINTRDDPTLVPIPLIKCSHWLIHLQYLCIYSCTNLGPDYGARPGLQSTY